eukprot:TRINITY_DN5324_c3_g1_i1.p1 TRINITY_DN5324_c3_g1~~TRINITY_DN5324_c3_g1_i1.p1  ORF type:complete len:440 (-),score=117.74 TRINITY_DN5324_c3_g1_i1:546-1865(-)
MKQGQRGQHHQSKKRQTTSSPTGHARKHNQAEGTTRPKKGYSLTSDLHLILQSVGSWDSHSDIEWVELDTAKTAHEQLQLIDTLTSFLLQNQHTVNIDWFDKLHTADAVVYNNNDNDNNNNYNNNRNNNRNYANFVPSDPPLPDSVTCRSPFAHRWAVIERIVRRALLAPSSLSDTNNNSNSNQSSRADNTQQSQHQHSATTTQSRFVFSCCRLVIGLALALKEDADLLESSDAEQSGSVLHSLSAFLRAGYLRPMLEGEERENAHHTAELHCAALVTTGVVLWIIDDQKMIAQFLESLTSYFTSDDDDPYSDKAMCEDIEVIRTALELWCMLLPALDEATIATIFTFPVVTALIQILDDDQRSAKVRVLCAELLHDLVRIDDNDSQSNNNDDAEAYASCCFVATLLDGVGLSRAETTQLLEDACRASFNKAAVGKKKE